MASKLRCSKNTKLTPRGSQAASLRSCSDLAKRLRFASQTITISTRCPSDFPLSLKVAHDVRMEVLGRFSTLHSGAHLIMIHTGTPKCIKICWDSCVLALYFYGHARNPRFNRMSPKIRFIGIGLCRTRFRMVPAAASDHVSVCSHLYSMRCWRSIGQMCMQHARLFLHIHTLHMPNWRCMCTATLAIWYHRRLQIDHIAHQKTCKAKLATFNPLRAFVPPSV